ncbi:MAG: hypothetical protein MMC33_001474 [Icmadophila ericetorum]|nr:hypothetical protein [Icmadophila ericetorum]
MAGGAYHPMLLYMSQGAKSVLEDGATLGALPARVSSKEQISKAIAVEHHLSDGPEQIARDLRLSKSFETTQTQTSQDEGCYQKGASKDSTLGFSYDGYGEVARAIVKDLL